jgi:hypothetical protein
LVLTREEVEAWGYTCPECSRQSAIPPSVRTEYENKRALEESRHQDKEKRERRKEAKERRRAEACEAAEQQQAAREAQRAKEEAARKAAWEAMSREEQVKVLLSRPVFEDTDHSYQACFQCLHCANLTATWIPKSVSAGEFIAEKGDHLLCPHCQHRLSAAKPTPMPERQDDWFFIVWW